MTAGGGRNLFLSSCFTRLAMSCSTVWSTMRRIRCQRHGLPSSFGDNRWRSIQG